MELMNGVSLDYVDGALVLKAEVKALVMAKIVELEAKIESGEIDPVKGTDIDKMAIMAAISALKGIL